MFLPPKGLKTTYFLRMGKLILGIYMSVLLRSNNPPTRYPRCKESVLCEEDKRSFPDGKEITVASFLKTFRFLNRFFDSPYLSLMRRHTFFL